MQHLSLLIMYNFSTLEEVPGAPQHGEDHGGRDMLLEA